MELTTEDGVYNYFLGEGSDVTMIGDRFYLTKDSHYLILDEEGDDTEALQTIVGCNIPYIGRDVNKAASLMIVCINTLGVVTTDLH